MGGYRGGELASRMLARIIPRELWQIHDDPVQSAESIAVAIRRCVVAANAAMIQLAVREESLRRMGATMVLGFLHNRTLYLTHYGDCRAYLVRSGRMCQLTTDQTFVQVLVEAGVITKEKARSHPQRHVVLNGVTAKEPVQAPEVAMVNLSRGDRLLFCSDGLWSAVDDEMLAQILESTADPQRAAKRLVSEALENDTWDNATCIVAHVDVQAMSRNVVNRPGQFIPWHDAA
jgi:protein phosphatase